LGEDSESKNLCQDPHFLQERGLEDYDKLADITRSATQKFNAMSGWTREQPYVSHDLLEILPEVMLDERRTA